MKRIYLELIMAAIIFFWVLCNGVIFRCGYEATFYPIIVIFFVQLFGTVLMAAAVTQEEDE